MTEENTVSPGLEALEWDQVHALVARSIASPAGAEEMAQVVPSTDRARIEHDLAETGEAMEYLRAAGQGGALRINLSGLPDVRAASRNCASKARRSNRAKSSN